MDSFMDDEDKGDSVRRSTASSNGSLLNSPTTSSSSMSDTGFDVEDVGDKMMKSSNSLMEQYEQYKRQKMMGLHHANGGHGGSRFRRLIRRLRVLEFGIARRRRIPILVLIFVGWIYLVLACLTGKVFPKGGKSYNWQVSSNIDLPFAEGCLDVVQEAKKPRANAVFVALARNSEIDGVLSSMKGLERHFNRWFNYPYVFLNDEPFDVEFRKAIRQATNAKVRFGRISPDDWNFPSWANQSVIDGALTSQGDRAIKYGEMGSYHRMCRFYSGKFFNHPLLADYDWYWRVEPDVTYFCDITYDPFLYMEKQNKVYGFTVFIKELAETVPNLFRYTTAFKTSRNLEDTRLWDVFLAKEEKSKKKMEEEQKDKKVKPKTKEDLLHEQLDKAPWNQPVDRQAMNGEKYNLCHFWSNFEIARLDFFRSKEYNDYFKSLEERQGFWFERWGDAPIHSLAAGLYLQPEQIHYFRDIGYRHTTIQHCPKNAPGKQRQFLPYEDDSEDDRAYWRNYDKPEEGGIGCRCRCDTDIEEQEAKDGSCLRQWTDITGGWELIPS